MNDNQEKIPPRYAAKALSLRGTRTLPSFSIETFPKNSVIPLMSGYTRMSALLRSHITDILTLNFMLFDLSTGNSFLVKLIRKSIFLTSLVQTRVLLCGTYQIRSNNPPSSPFANPYTAQAEMIHYQKLKVKQQQGLTKSILNFRNSMVPMKNCVARFYSNILTIGMLKKLFIERR